MDRQAQPVDPAPISGIRDKLGTQSQDNRGELPAVGAAGAKVLRAIGYGAASLTSTARLLAGGAYVGSPIVILRLVLAGLLRDDGTGRVVLTDAGIAWLAADDVERRTARRERPESCGGGRHVGPHPTLDELA